MYKMDIGDLHIDQLSGPVSFHYYFPREEAFAENAEKGVFLPIIILLGDEHGKEEKRCSPCDEEKGCYLVEGNSFLNTLNELAKLYPIDIYTEHAPGKKVEDNRGVLFSKFIKPNIDCIDRYYFENKEDYLTSRKNVFRCKYPGIRWHYADPRYWKGKVEFEASLVANYIYQILLARDTDRDTKELRDSMTSSLFQEFLENLIEMGDKQRPMRILGNKLSLLMKETLQKNDSIINKQIKKTTLDLNIESYCSSSLRFHGVMTEEGVSRVFDVERVKNLYEHIFKDSSLSFRDKLTLRIALKPVFNMWTVFTACLLDVYFLVRMTKPKKSYLTLGFFGHRHCDAIADFIETDLYEFKYSSKESGRCLQLNGRIDFNKDLELYSRWRDLYKK